MELTIPHEDIILRQKQMISDLQHQLMLSEMGFGKLAAENGKLEKENEELKTAARVAQNQPEAGE